MKGRKKIFLIVFIILCVFLLNGCRKKYSYDYASTVSREIGARMLEFEQPSIIGVGTTTDGEDGWFVVVQLHEDSAQKDEIIQWLKEDYGKVVRIEIVDYVNELF
ncbi:MAG: hypothetical protein IJ333_09660 [Clostridia bacterium]|nr:hypothetical protein [Clostridia bacterium]